MSDQKPFSYQFIIERWADGLKVLGAGNGTGFLASAAALQSFSSKPELLSAVKTSTGFFFGGVILFAVAYLVLTILPLAILNFVEESGKTHDKFTDMTRAFVRSKKSDAVAFMTFMLTAILSFFCFIGGCFQLLPIVLS